MSYIGKSPAVAALTASDITDGIISNVKLAQDIISADTALGAEPADTDELLVSDAGTLKRMDYSYIKASGGKFESALLHVRDEKSSGTDGGSSTSGSYQTRTLNTVKTNEISGASLGSNRIVLPAGTYYIQARANVRAAGKNKCKLYNITDSADTIIGSNQLNTSGTGEQDDSTIFGRFTIDSTDSFEIQHRVSSNQSGDGYGIDCSFSDVEVYAEAMIWKVS